MNLRDVKLLLQVLPYIFEVFEIPKNLKWFPQGVYYKLFEVIVPKCALQILSKFSKL